MTASSFVAFAKTFLGIPYIWGGMSQIGADCSGLAHMLLRKINLEPPERTAAGMYQHFVNHGTRISFSAVNVGDLCFYRNKKGKVIHIAVGVGPGLVIEAAHGGPWSVSRAIARLRGAKVIIASQNRHGGLFAVIRPKGLPWA